MLLWYIKHISCTLNTVCIMMQPSELTFMTRVEQMFSKVTAKNPFLEYSWLLESSPWRARENERTKESNQLAMLPQHWFAGLIRCGLLGKMGWKLQVVRHFVSYYCYTFAWEETNLETSLTTPPHRFFWRWHVNHRNHISYLPTNYSKIWKSKLYIYKTYT